MLSADMPLHKAVDPYDVNDDTFVTPTDLLRIVNAINGESLPENESLYLDVNGDGVFNLDDYYAQRGAYDDPDEYDAPDANFVNSTSELGPSGPMGPDGATGPLGSHAPAGATGPTGGTGPSGLSNRTEPTSATSPSGPSAPDDPTGSVQSPTACDTDGSPPQLSGGTVDEGAELNLGHIPEENPEGHDVVWVYVDAEGISRTFIVGDDAIITFMDDNPTNTPSDSVEVELTFVLVGDCGELYEKTQTRTVTVHNVPPTANDDTLQVGNQVSKTINVLENDTDPGTDTLSIASIDTSATNGTVSHIGGGSFEYDPGEYYACLGEGETATDTFEYAIHDDDDPDSTSWATVTVTVVGSRQMIWVTYGSGPSSEDDGNGNPAPALSHITLDPAPTCGDVTVNYAPASTPDLWAGHLDPDQIASPSDIENSSDSVVISSNTSVAEFELVPVDDELIERTEWYFWTVEADDTDNYFFLVDQETAVTHIEDDEWRFVAESRTETQTILPHIEVEAFSYPWFSSYLSGHVDYTGGYNTRYGTSVDSTGFAQGQSQAALTRASGGENAAAHNGGYEFSCHSQTGVIWVSNTVNSGHKQDGPLVVYTNATYTITELDDAEKNINIYLPTAFLAGGEITNSGTVGGTTGSKVTKGTLGITSAVTYDGGDEHPLNGNFNLRCRRGE